MAVLDPPDVDSCVEYVALLGLAQQEALDVSSDQLVTYVLLDGQTVLGWNHALFEAEVLVGAVVVMKEMKHSVEYRPHFVNLVRLVNGLINLIDQVQEAQQGDEAVSFHEFPETGGARNQRSVRTKFWALRHGAARWRGTRGAQNKQDWPGIPGSKKPAHPQTCCQNETWGPEAWSSVLAGAPGASQKQACTAIQGDS